MNGTKTKFLLCAALVGTMAFTFASCSESENVESGGILNVDPSYISKGIETEVKSAVIEVPVKCSGKWFAVVDSCDWLDVMDDGTSIHEGNGVVKLKVDENRTQVARRNTLSILDFNNNEIEIPVYQNNTYKGEPLTNGAASWFQSNSIGCGADYTYFMQPDATRGSADKKSFDPISVARNNNIFNLATLETKQSTGSSSDQLYVNAQIPIAQLNDKALVNSIAKSQTLDATVEMGCSFGFIEFQAQGQYKGTLEDSSDYVCYSICREAPVLSSNLQVATIASLAADAAEEEIFDKDIDDQVDELLEQYEKASNADKKAKIQNKIKRLYKTNFGGYFSKSFTDIYSNLYYLNENKNTLFPDPVQRQKEFDKYFAMLDSNFGPFFISGGQFGGSLNMYATVDRKNLDEGVEFNAEITANIADGFSLEGAANFSSAGKQLYKNSNVVMNVYGGNAAVTLGAITDFLNGDMTDTQKLQEILKEWTDSFAETDEEDDGSVTPKKAAPITFNLTPIWTLFANADLQDMAQEYFLNKYKDKGIDDWNRVIKGESLGDVESFLRKLADSKTAK